jgi:oligopeptide transport system substrate-binding protein
MGAAGTAATVPGESPDPSPGASRRSFVRRHRLAILALSVLAVAAATGVVLLTRDRAPEPAARPVSAAGARPLRGGTLVVTFENEPVTLDPAVAWDTESWSIERLAYQTFLTYASDAGSAGTTLVPDLAKEVPTVENGGISRNGLVYTFHLRRGVRFAPPVDREITAADFKYSFERMLREPLAPATSFYTGIAGAQAYLDGTADGVEGFEATDDHTVRVTLTAPDAAFLTVMSLPFTSVLPREWVDEVGTQLARRPLGTRPYMVDVWTPGTSITAVRNPNWSGKNDQWLDGMEFDIVSPGSALARLERGDADVLGDPIPASDYQRTKQDPTWGKYVVDAPQIAWYYVFMDVREGPFQDSRVRRAVNYAIDTQKLQKLLGGQGLTLDQLYPEGMPGHETTPQYYSYYPERARTLLAQAGYPDGFSTVLATHDVEPFPQLAKTIQADLKAVGIEAEIEEMDRASYWHAIGTSSSHIAIGVGDWYMDYPDPSDWIGPLFTDPADGGANASFYSDARVDRLFAESRRESDPEKRIALFREMQAIVMREAPTAPLYQPVWNAMYGTATGGFYVHPVWTFNFSEFWMTGGR